MYTRESQPLILGPLREMLFAICAIFFVGANHALVYTRVALLNVTGCASAANDGRFMIINVKFDSRASNDLDERRRMRRRGEGQGQLARRDVVMLKKGGHGCVL